jgi:hypothetical protein
MECEYCKNTFKNNTILKSHQKTAKYCLKIRNETTTFNCSFCNLNLSTNNRLQSHMSVCSANNPYIQNMFKELETLKLEITSLREIEKKYNELLDKVTKSALEPKKVVNNINNNNIRIFSRTDEEIDEIYNKYMTIGHIIGGVDSMAQLTVDKIIKDTYGNAMITITDKSRQNAVYKAPTGEIVKDFGLKSFTDRAKKSINKRMFPLIVETENKELDSSIVFKGINDITDDANNEKLARKIVKYI